MATKSENVSKVIGAIAPLFVSCIVLAVQWGVVTTKLEIFEANLDKIIEVQDKENQRTTDAIEKTNDTLSKVQSDLSFIKGKMKESE